MSFRTILKHLQQLTTLKPETKAAAIQTALTTIHLAATAILPALGALWISHLSGSWLALHTLGIVAALWVLLSTGYQLYRLYGVRVVR